MPIDSATQLIEQLAKLHILDAGQAQEAADSCSQFPDARVMAGELIRRDWLTPYQVNLIFQHRGEELQLGSYVLLNRIGEGGMGAVFKARNWKLGTTAALKLIRKERLNSEDSIRRFHREIRAAAQLDHPNIVRAIDADNVGGTHLLVMEYVDGRDLRKVVKENGPLPVADACEYIRQAALGLQHAHERGIVHRDIKPHNLLLSGIRNQGSGFRSQEPDIGQTDS